jgi:uncharacterized protein (DUF305 family)
MNKETMLVGIVALLIGGIGGYAITEVDSDHRSSNYTGRSVEKTGMHMMPDGSMMGNSETEVSDTGMMGGMNGMDHMMSMMVENEREFISGMIPHHQEAVDTAKEVIARGGTTPEIKKLAENIVVAQEKEIAAMKEWYKNWYGEGYTNSGKYEPMMRELTSLSGQELDRAFLEDMIMHHMGAIMMAHSAQLYDLHKETEELAEAIIITQAAEIKQMRQILQGL